MGKNNYFGKKGKCPYSTLFGSDAHKELMYKMNLYTPEYMIDTWLDYFATKPRVKVLNPEQVECFEKPNPGKDSSDSLCLLNIIYAGQEDNFITFLEEFQDIASHTKSYPNVIGFIPVVIQCKYAKLENGQLKKITLGNPSFKEIDSERVKQILKRNSLDDV
ncbi:MAG: hypothetical protein NTY20_05170 [Candidatus Aenigmarchaeota archaeon]|nr:hypothetical protein [Candidatus Aenigmarchaeota archaeon]